MLLLAIILLFVTIFLLTRFIALKKEVKKITKQLQNYNDRKTNKKIDMTLFDQEMEKLGQELNTLIDLHVAENRKRLHFENEQKKAIANMSHDLRTPLTSIIGYIQMANNDDVTDRERKDLLTTASERAKRLERLLNDFFELSMIESVDYTLESERINLKKITVDVLMSFYDLFQEKHLEPTIHLSENDVFIFADESAVIRVIENLLSNALTHSDGNIMIKLNEEESTVQLIVKNDAFSLTEQDVERMFDRFFMADLSRSGKSSGLGLSIVKSLMEKMNGTITGDLKDGQLSIVCEWKTVKSQ
ncbi:sensor histidine kinase [Aliibacillus thermotolerans]|uniref:histidine kinase n=1 Tax=Aliibacillus thermotolerans TaxID=1834418 RepID=A0ABW0U3I7_9BACI|nr:HAMP domain-containing sensor histidine kinase [Aliibacillus thermotolerans]MDA3129420.1 GHKL domain-containing protein [Aliibacillus thermotolerans]